AQSGSVARKGMGVITTEWRFHSHAWHMAERFLVGYPIDGRWHHPPIDVVGAYVDQPPANDLSRKRSEELKFPLFPTVAEALRCGGQELAGGRGPAHRRARPDPTSHDRHSKDTTQPG